MRIISYNVNGIRAAIKKGLVDWLATDPADLVCIQETKARPEDVDVTDIEKLGYNCFWFSAEKKGYSGVAMLSKVAPDAVMNGTGHGQSDLEGRVMRADFGDLSVVNAYFPSGTTGDIRQRYKYVWLNEFFEHIQNETKTRKKMVICGDYNIAHRELDIHDPKGNKNTSGFLPEERAWMDKWFAAGFADAFRQLYPEQSGAYSWWSQRFPSVRLQNKGWRIDYISITDNLKPQLVEAAILPDVKQSDHCPVYIKLDV